MQPLAGRLFLGLHLRMQRELAAVGVWFDRTTSPQYCVDILIIMLMLQAH